MYANSLGGDKGQAALILAKLVELLILAENVDATKAIKALTKSLHSGMGEVGKKLCGILEFLTENNIGNAIKSLREIKESLKSLRIKAWKRRNMRFIINQLVALIAMANKDVFASIKNVAKEMWHIAKSVDSGKIREFCRKVEELCGDRGKYRVMSIGEKIVLKPTIRKLSVIATIAMIMELEYEKVEGLRKSVFPMIRFELQKEIVRAGNKHETRSLYVSIYDMIISRSGMSNKKYVDEFVEKASRMKSEEKFKNWLKNKFVAKKLRVREEIRGVITKYLTPYYRRVKAWEKRGMSKREIVNRILERMRILEKYSILTIRIKR